MTKPRRNPAKKTTGREGLLVLGPVGGPRIVILFDLDALLKADVDDELIYDGTLILGFMSMADSPLDDSFYEINGAAAVKGWGPATYNIAAEVAGLDGQEGIHPDSGSITNAALRVWKKWPKSRQKYLRGSRIGFALLPPLHQQVRSMTSQTNTALKRAAKRFGWTKEELETHLWESAEREFLEAHSKQQQQERAAR